MALPIIRDLAIFDSLSISDNLVEPTKRQNETKNVRFHRGKSLSFDAKRESCGVAEGKSALMGFAREARVKVPDGAAVGEPLTRFVGDVVAHRKHASPKLGEVIAQGAKVVETFERTTKARES